MENKEAVLVLQGNKIEGIFIQEINKEHSFDEVISIAQSNYDFLTEQSKNKSISRFNAMRCERNYWKGVKELAEQRKEACLALEKVNKLMSLVETRIEDVEETIDCLEQELKTLGKEDELIETELNACQEHLDDLEEVRAILNKKKEVLCFRLN